MNRFSVMMQLNRDQQTDYILVELFGSSARFVEKFEVEFICMGKTLAHSRLTEAIGGAMQIKLRKGDLFQSAYL